MFSPNQKRIRSIYYSAKKRCENKKCIAYKYYGMRGIRFLFNGIAEFEKEMGDSYIEHLKIHGEENTTLDRINANGDYCKENCRWATTKEQQINKRNPIKYFTYNGETHTQGEWIKLIGLNR